MPPSGRTPHCWDICVGKYPAGEPGTVHEDNGLRPVRVCGTVGNARPVTFPRGDGPELCSAGQDDLDGSVRAVGQDVGEGAPFGSMVRPHRVLMAIQSVA